MSIDAISNSSGLAAMLAGQMGSSLPTAAQLAADRQALLDAASNASSATTSSSASSTTGSLGSGMGTAKAATPAEIKKVASQFEAIILRQMLAPTIEPIMSGGSGGSSEAGGGAGIYGYMVTDVLANSMSKGGGLGLAGILEKQLSPKHPALTSSDNSQTT
jgi:flagellar protein FlgJ